MKAEEITRGLFYRYKRSNLIFGIVGEWPEQDGEPRRVEYFTIDHTGTIADWSKQDTAEAVAAKVSEQVAPDWTAAEALAPSCSERGYHDFPSMAPTATCADCGLPLHAAAELLRVRKEQEALLQAQEQEQLPEVDAQEEPPPSTESASFAASLLKGADE